MEHQSRFASPVNSVFCFRSSSTSGFNLLFCLPMMNACGAVWRTVYASSRELVALRKCVFSECCLPQGRMVRSSSPSAQREALSRSGECACQVANETKHNVNIIWTCGFNIRINKWSMIKYYLGMCCASEWDRYLFWIEK